MHTFISIISMIAFMMWLLMSFSFKPIGQSIARILEDATDRIHPIDKDTANKNCRR